MYCLKYAIVGKDSGDFRYSKVSRGLFLMNLKEEMDKRGIQKVFAPVCQFTTRIEKFGRKEDEQIITPWFIRTQSKADGSIIIEPGVAAAILNADCPVIILFDSWLGYLVMLHGGFRCIVPENKDSPNIIDTAFQDFHLRPHKIEAVITFGAGSCCYGIDHVDELKKPEFRNFIGKANKGPRAGQNSLDIYGLIKQKLLDSGVPESSISIDDNCTACAGRDSNNGHYHSNIYEGESAGRNLVLAWFEPDPDPKS